MIRFSPLFINKGKKPANHIWLSGTKSTLRNLFIYKEVWWTNFVDKHLNRKSNIIFKQIVSLQFVASSWKN